MLDIMLKGMPSGASAGSKNGSLANAMNGLQQGHGKGQKLGGAAPADQVQQLQFIDVLRNQPGQPGQPGQPEVPITLPGVLPGILPGETPGKVPGEAPVIAQPVDITPELPIDEVIAEPLPGDPEYALPLPQQLNDPNLSGQSVQAPTAQATATTNGAALSASHAQAIATPATAAATQGANLAHDSQAGARLTSEATAAGNGTSGVFAGVSATQTVQVASNSPLMAALERIQQAHAQVARINTTANGSQAQANETPLTQLDSRAQINTATMTSVAPLISATAQAQGQPSSLNATSATNAAATSGMVIGASEGLTGVATAEANAAQLAAQMNAQAMTQTASSQATPQGALTAPLATPAWQAQLSQQVGEQVNQLVNMRFHGDQVVRLRLHPAELGPLMITMKVEDQAAQLQFMSNHSQVRQAVEQALPQLRELLAEQGIDLNESSVSDHGQQEQQTASRENNATQGSETSQLADNSADIPVENEVQLQVGPGRVDLFA
ncbi:MAG: flagellar hook-length control protein FliK [Gammaproteobacteria bacterium]|nr:flagellar hook-length control protein FliK [Gammaproteobacteria bacterium]